MEKEPDHSLLFGSVRFVSSGHGVAVVGSRGVTESSREPTGSGDQKQFFRHGVAALRSNIAPPLRGGRSCGSGPYSVGSLRSPTATNRDRSAVERRIQNTLPHPSLEGRGEKR